MIDIRPARETEVVLAFLKAEIDYSDQRQVIHQNIQTLGVTKEQLLDESNLDNDCCNAVRAIILDSYRGYLRRTGVFAGFPKDVSWRRIELEPRDLERLRYVRSLEWLPISEGTRRPQRVTDRIERGELPDLAEKILAIQKRLKCGEILPELIAVEGEAGDLILIEGCHRTTAYVGLKWNANVPAYLGKSPLMRDWVFY
jgi:hypothetical protein